MSVSPLHNYARARQRCVSGPSHMYMSRGSACSPNLHTGLKPKQDESRVNDGGVVNVPQPLVNVPRRVNEWRVHVNDQAR